MESHPLFFRSRLAAFTLIELLVVISIIALLIGILLPALASARYTARLTADLTQLRQISIASTAYSTDFDGFYPAQYFQSNQLNVSIDEQLVPYLQGVTYTFQEAFADQFVQSNEIDMTIWRSPLDILPNAFDLDGTAQKRSYAITRAPNLGIANLNSFERRNNTGVSRRISVDADGEVAAGNNGYSRREENVLQSSDTITYAPFFRSAGFCGWSNQGDTTGNEIFNVNRGYNGNGALNGWQNGPSVWYGYGGPGGESGDNPLEYSANFTFADGHSSSVLGADTLNPSAPGTFRTDGQSLWNSFKR